MADLVEIAASVARSGERHMMGHINASLAQLGTDVRVAEIPLKDAKTALYRHYNKAGQLLYVGISLHASLRLIGHKSTATWLYDVTRIEIEWFANRGLASAAETKAIQTEKPIHNIAQSDYDYSRAFRSKRARRIMYGKGD